MRDVKCPPQLRPCNVCDVRVWPGSLPSHALKSPSLATRETEKLSSFLPTPSWSHLSWDGSSFPVPHQRSIPPLSLTPFDVEIGIAEEAASFSSRHVPQALGASSHPFSLIAFHPHISSIHALPRKKCIYAKPSQWHYPTP